MKRSPIPILLVVLALFSACSGPSREKTLNTALTAVNAAREGWMAWDSARQDAIIAASTSLEQGKAALAEYRTKQQAPIVKAFVVAYLAIGVAATRTDDLSMRVALGAINDLATKVQSAMAAQDGAK